MLCVRVCVCVHVRVSMRVRVRVRVRVQVCRPSGEFKCVCSVLAGVHERWFLCIRRW